MSAVLWEILGIVLGVDAVLFLLRHRIAGFWASHGWFEGFRSDDLQSDLDTEVEIEEMKKWKDW
jgi:hypothetical protein